MTDKYINPFTDFGFKKIFGEEANKDLLIDFLNELLPKKSKIVHLQYLKTEQLGAKATDRKAVYDLYCQNDKGEKFIVEIQKAKQKYFKDRSVYYATFPIQEQAEKGEWDYELQGVYSIAIMDFVFHDAYHTDFRHDVQLMEVNRKELFYDKLMFLYLEMPKFNKSIDELANHYEKWLFLLKNLSSFDKMPEKFKEKVFKKLFEVAAIANYNESEQQAYQDSLRYYRDWKNVLDNKYEEGKAEGFEEGKAEGFEEGKAEGFEEGKKKGLYNTAKNMKQKGFSITTIIELTGLSEDEIQLL